MKVPCNGWQNRKKRDFFCLYLKRTVIGTARLVEINKIGVQTVVNIVNAKNPTTVKLFIYFMSGCINGSEVKAVIWREPVLIDPAEILCERSFYNVKFFRIRSCVSAGKNKHCGKLPVLI